MGRHKSIRFERGRRLTRRGYARHPLFTYGGKRDLNGEYHNVKKKQLINFQAPLSGEAEERVAGVASPGESSSPCDVRQSLFSILSNFTNSNHLFFYQALLLITLFYAGCSSDKPKVNNVKINLTPDKHSLKITGLDPLIVQDINRDSSGGNWQSLVPVFKMPIDTELKNYQPIQPGKYVVTDSVVVFTPDTPFIAQQTYFVRYYKFDANSKASDFILGKNKLGSLHYTDLIFKQ
ncbi:hypothetical protein [Mucilaginibacter sp. OK283]|uniref:hypothetical protein n=1 Tax=Mucilaginibacter sp. OK283 TaxID=1881049 RepID=UPI0008BE6320|nr:hypothetical protein [Mucilaginibacter sp. OK283]SEP24198.1 hypothetical protein SAMN05428947_10929 [Mucilaginibacter sp. OK283]